MLRLACRPHHRAFTLVEIILALTVIAVMAAASIPVIHGLRRDERFREPLQSLASIISEARSRAMREHRSYQIVFEPRGIHASPAMYPHRRLDDFLADLARLRTPPELPPSSLDPSTQPAPWQPPWSVSIPVDDQTECGVLLWGDGDWDVLDDGRMRRWVFQPAGISAPAKVRLRSDGGEMEADFDGLTGEITAERSRIVSQQP